ncbi:MAG: hypothetical protein ACXW2U_01145 [Telluria sp.]
MNANATGAGNATGGYAASGRPRRLLAGVSASLALHALLLFAYRHHLTSVPAGDGVEPARSIAIWLRPPEALKPAAAPKPAREPARLSRLPRHAPAPARTPTAARTSDLIAIPDRTPGQQEAPDVFSVEPQGEPKPGSTPRFDRHAAFRLARKMADEPDPARADTAVGQIPPKAYETETKLARAISRAKRRDCKDGIPGGLLAPLILLMDKKDSGCKW